MNSHDHGHQGSTPPPGQPVSTPGPTGAQPQQAQPGYVQPQQAGGGQQPQYASPQGQYGAPPPQPQVNITLAQNQQVQGYGGPPPKSVGTAYLLWFLGCGGVLGLHRFYTGRIGSGVLWLLTLGLCGVGAFIDLALIPGHCRQPK